MFDFLSYVCLCSEFVKLELIFVVHYYHSICAFLIELYSCIYILFINPLLILEGSRKLSPKNLEIRGIRSHSESEIMKSTFTGRSYQP